MNVNQAGRVLSGGKTPGGLPLEQTRIVPGNSTPSIPEIESPEEFFMRSGVRSDPGREGEPFFPSGYLTYRPDGQAIRGFPDGRVDVSSLR